MFGILHALRSLLNPSRPPVRISAGIGGPTIGRVDAIEHTPEGVVIRGTLDDFAAEYLGGRMLDGYSIDPPSAVLEMGGIDVSPRHAHLLAELQAAVPRPDLERAIALAEYSQRARPGHDEHEFAWTAFTDAGGASLSAWRAFQAGLRAQVDRMQQ